MNPGYYVIKLAGYYGDWYEEVRITGYLGIGGDGHILNPAKSLEVVNHSPDGFAWGYSGSGPSQLALAVLLECGVPRDVAVKHYGAFRDRFIAPLPRESFSVEIDVKTWLDARLADCPTCPKLENPNA